jgi:hypothetical protein
LQHDIDLRIRVDDVRVCNRHAVRQQNGAAVADRRLHKRQGGCETLEQRLGPQGLLGAAVAGELGRVLVGRVSVAVVVASDTDDDQSGNEHAKHDEARGKPRQGRIASSPHAAQRVRHGVDGPDQARSPAWGDALVDRRLHHRVVERWPARRKWRRLVAVVAVLAGPVVLATACGDDGGDESADTTADTTSETTANETASVCDARDELDSSLEALGEVDISAENTNALEADVREVRDDIDAVADAAQEEAGDEVDDLRTALDELETAVGEFGDQESTSAAVAAVGSAVTDLARAAGALSEALAQECGSGN